MSFVFSTSSYAFSLKLDEASSSSLAGLYSQFGVRLNAHLALAELLSDLSRVRYLVAIHVPSDFALDDFPELQIWEFALSYSTSDLDADVRSVIKKLIPEQLESLGISAVQRLLPSFFDGMTMAIQSIDMDKELEYDLAIQCDSSAWPFVGRCVLFFNQEKLHGVVSDGFMTVLSRRSLADLLREFVNQFLGVVNQSLVALGYNCRIGLPLVFSKADIGSLLNTGLFVPSLRFADERGIFDLRLGFVNGSAGPIMNLEGIAFPDSFGDVDYL